MSVVPSMIRVVKTPTLPRDDDELLSAAGNWQLATDNCLDLAFADWLAETAERIRVAGDGRRDYLPGQLHDLQARAHWLADKVDELCQLAHFLDAATPEQFDARKEAVDLGLRDRAYYAGFMAAETPEPEYGYGAGR